MKLSSLTAFFQTYGKYLYLPAIACGVAGGIAIRVTGVSSSLYIGLLAVAVIFAALWLIWLLRQTSGFWGRRSTQSNANVLASTVAVIAILVVINYLAFRYPLSFDLTENQRFTLAAQSQSLVANLRQPLKVWIFDDAPSDADKKLLENYRQYNDQFEFEFINPDRNPKLVQDFNVQNKGDVFLQYGNKKQLVQNLISFEQREPLSEIQLTNAIEKIQRQEAPHLYLVQGHGELPLNTDKTGLSEAIKALQNKGFVVNPLNLVTDGGIPDNADALLIVGPERKFLPPEIEGIKRYSERGGNVLVMVAPNVDAGLEPFLKPWGVSLDPRLVIDISGSGSALGLDPTIPIFNQYGKHPITEKLQGAIAIFPFVRPVATVAKPNIKATTLIEASAAMFATQTLTQELQPNPETDLLGPFDIAVALEREKAAPKPVPSPSPSPSPNASPDSSPSPSPSPSLTPSPSPSPNSSPSPSPSPSLTPSPSPSLSPSPSPTLSPSPTPTTSPNNTSYNPGNIWENIWGNNFSLMPAAIAQVPSPSPSLSPSESNAPDAKAEEKKVDAAAQTEAKPPAKLVVIGSTLFVTNAWFNESVNGDIFLNSAQWLAEKTDQPLSLRAKDPTDRRITLKPIQASILGWLTWVIVPLIGLLLAVWTWWRQR